MTSYYEYPTFDNCEHIKYGIVLNDINWENFSEEINLSGWILSKASVYNIFQRLKLLKLLKPFQSQILNTYKALLHFVQNLMMQNTL
jgi:hypothetical protein